MPHEASKIPRGSDQKQMIVIGHQTLGEDFDTQGYGSCAALEKGLVTGGGPGGRLASQPTVHHRIDRTPDIQAASVEPYDKLSTRKRNSTTDLTPILITYYSYSSSRFCD